MSGDQRPSVGRDLQVVDVAGDPGEFRADGCSRRTVERADVGVGLAVDVAVGAADVDLRRVRSGADGVHGAVDVRLECRVDCTGDRRHDSSAGARLPPDGGERTADVEFPCCQRQVVDVAVGVGTECWSNGARGGVDRCEARPAGSADRGERAADVQRVAVDLDVVDGVVGIGAEGCDGCAGGGVEGGEVPTFDPLVPVGADGLGERAPDVDGVAHLQDRTTDTVERPRLHRDRRLGGRPARSGGWRESRRHGQGYDESEAQ